MDQTPTTGWRELAEDEPIQPIHYYRSRRSGSMLPISGGNIAKTAIGLTPTEARIAFGAPVKFYASDDQPAPTASAPRKPAEFFEYRHLEIARIVDGDTLDVRLDLGFSIYHAIRLRLYGINAPEISTPQGPPARDYLRQLLDGEVEAKLVLRTFKDKTDKYGRYIADLRGSMGSISEAMLAAGHAQRFMENLNYSPAMV